MIGSDASISFSLDPFLFIFTMKSVVVKGSSLLNTAILQEFVYTFAIAYFKMSIYGLTSGPTASSPDSVFAFFFLRSCMNFPT